MQKAYDNGHFYSASQFYREKFGTKVYKISLDAGCTCPNRDGTKGFGGCIFCSESGSGDFSADRTFSIENQVSQAKALVRKKVGGGKYIAYFQNFSSTYGKSDVLLEKYRTAASQEDVVGLSIATRPDCVFPEILSGISEMAEEKFVSIELGLQTSKKTSADYVRRLYTNEEYADAVERIKMSSPGIHVVTHLIFGLPCETESDMLESLDFALRSGTDGVKISVLHVLEGTALRLDYEKGLFNTLSMEEYFHAVGRAIMRAPENVVFHRLTGDGAKKTLVAPLWTSDKKNVLNSLSSYLRENQIVQGSDF